MVAIAAQVQSRSIYSVISARFMGRPPFAGSIASLGQQPHGMVRRALALSCMKKSGETKKLGMLRDSLDCFWGNC